MTEKGKREGSYKGEGIRAAPRTPSPGVGYRADASRDGSGPAAHRSTRDQGGAA